MRYTVKLFGPQAVKAGTREVQLDLPDVATAADVLQALRERCPQIRDSVSASRLAVNQELASPELTIKANDEIALIGMVSGG
jgi:molybdopterin converting factor small subunit